MNRGNRDGRQNGWYNLPPDLNHEFVLNGEIRAVVFPDWSQVGPDDHTAPTRWHSSHPDITRPSSDLEELKALTQALCMLGG